MSIASVSGEHIGQRILRRRVGALAGEVEGIRHTPFGVRHSFIYFNCIIMAAAQTASGYCSRPLLQPCLAAL